jgi:hypothetical protein
MKRRSEQNDYTERGIYMVTLAIEGRKALLGTLVGNADVTSGPDAPHVVLSPLGKRVGQCWLDISRYYPQVETMKLCIMPDHIHGVLFVHDRIERHLGHVINGFKAGTRKAARELGVIAEAVPQPTEPALPQMATLYIGKGKKDKISKGDIVGFLCKKGGLTPAEIGRIDVNDRYAYAAVSRQQVQQVLRMVNGEKIKGLRTVVEPVR